MARHGQKHRTQTKPQERQKHPSRWQKDLNPKRLQGQNVGPHRADDIKPRSAADIKELTRTLAELSTDELKDIPIVATGTRLEQGAIYLDLRNPARGPFQATAEMFSTEENLHAPKAEIPYELWNRLVSILCPDAKHRTAGSESAEDRESRNAGVSEQMIDKAIADSFPTSDPPSWTTGREKESEHSDREKGSKKKK